MTKYIFYLLCCKSKDINDFYIGSTKDLTYRKYQHKFHSTSPNSMKRHQAKYQCIINNGGYDNWEIIELGSLEGSKRDAYHHESHLIASFNPSLNIRKPIK